MKNYPVDLSEKANLLPSSQPLDTLRQKGLDVLNGLDSSLAEQLITVSRQPHIKKYCANDGKRFANLDTLKEWQAKGRLALPMVRAAGSGILELVGFGWMGPQKPNDNEPEIPGATTTFAIRIYEAAVGQHNALPYTQAILAIHGELYGNDGVWLEAWGDNLSAVKTYEKAGFQHVAEIAGSRHGVDCSRVYMTLGDLSLAD